MSGGSIADIAGDRRNNTTLHYLDYAIAAAAAAATTAAGTIVID